MPAFCVELLKPRKRTLEMSPKIIFLTPLPVPPYTPPIPASHPLKLLQPSASGYSTTVFLSVGAGSFLCLVVLDSWTFQTYTERAGSGTNPLTPTVSEARAVSCIGSTPVRIMVSPVASDVFACGSASSVCLGLMWYPWPFTAHYPCFHTVLSGLGPTLRHKKQLTD